ncbi:MAG TPA: hypothetical protein VE735_08015 [Gammaproteobacteria bacterium]|jgi:hypothetical protein|nr:hypothetical protein [Gammaproteobacteria bacterium]
MNAHKQLKDPAQGGVLYGLAFLVGKGLLLAFEGLTETVFQGGIDQQREDHDHLAEPCGFRVVILIAAALSLMSALFAWLLIEGRALPPNNSIH